MKRRSSIELLKIITIVLIVLSHCVQSFNLPVGVASENKIELAFNFIRCFGQFGNIVFIICSFWFFIVAQLSRQKSKVFIMNDIIGSYLESGEKVLIHICIKLHKTESIAG